MMKITLIGYPPYVYLLKVGSVRVSLHADNQYAQIESNDRTFSRVTQGKLTGLGKVEPKL